MANENFRSQLKATSMKSLQKQIDAENSMVGTGSSTEYLNLEDGKTIKIRIFPGHPGMENFYTAKKCYWLPFVSNDGEPRRGQVLDSVLHGGTKYDIVSEYVKFAKKAVGNDTVKLDALVGVGMNSNSLNPQYSWVCYAAKISGEDTLRAKQWEFKKMVRDALNKMAMSEDDDEPIEVDPFTDPDEGLPIMVTYNKQPNKKKGENYYDVAFPKKAAARVLTDEEIEHFLSLKPLKEMYTNCYQMRDFEKALEGLQCFDESNEIGLFEDESWLERVEEIKAQYEGNDEDEQPKKKVVKKVSKYEDDEDEEQPKKKVVVKEAAKAVKPADDEEEEEDEEDDVKAADEFDKMDRSALKAYISDKELEISIKKSMTDDDIRIAIRNASATTASSDEEEDEEDDDEGGSVMNIDDLRKKMFK